MQYLIEKIAQGDEKAFKLFYESFFIPLYNFAKKFSFSDDLAQDLSQETLLKYWERRINFDNFNQVRSFLYMTIRNASFNALEHQEIVERVHTRLSETTPIEASSNVDDMIIEEETYRQLRDAITKLPRRSQEIMLLTLKGLTNEKIAETLNISKETVRSQKKIAHKKLRLYIHR